MGTATSLQHDFSWIDSQWSLSKFKSLSIGSDSWNAFFGGNLPSAPVVSIIGYKIMKPSYGYLIRNDINYRITGGYGIGNHLFTLYYNTTIGLEKGGLIDLYYSTNYESKNEVIDSIYRYENYLVNLPSKERKEFLDRLAKLMVFITDKLIKSTVEKDIEVLYSLFDLMPLFEVLNDKVISTLISISKRPIKKYHYLDRELAEYIKINSSNEYANILLEIYKNLYKGLLGSSLYIYTEQIWNFIIREAEIKGSEDEILEICVFFIKRGDDRLHDCFTKVEGEVNKT